MNQGRKFILYNGTGTGPQGRDGAAFNVHEQPIMLASAGLTAPVGIQVMNIETGLWFDVMANAMPVQLTPENTFLFLSIQGAYRLKPGIANGKAVIWASEVTHVPEWDNGKYTDDGSEAGGSGAGGGSITLPITWTNLDGSISGRVGQ